MMLDENKFCGAETGAKAFAPKASHYRSIFIHLLIFSHKLQVEKAHEAGSRIDVSLWGN